MSNDLCCSSIEASVFSAWLWLRTFLFGGFKMKKTKKKTRKNLKRTVATFLIVAIVLCSTPLGRLLNQTLPNWFECTIKSSAAGFVFVGDSSLSTSADSTKDEPNVIYLGDANHDGAVNSTDALKVLAYRVGSGYVYGPYRSDADVNGDATLNSTDALMILKISVGSQAMEIAPDRVLYYIYDSDGNVTTTYTPTIGAYCYVDSGMVGTVVNEEGKVSGLGDAELKMF